MLTVCVYVILQSNENPVAVNKLKSMCIASGMLSYIIMMNFKQLQLFKTHSCF